MPSYTPISSDDAAKFAADIVSRIPPHPMATDADRADLTAALTSFLSRCHLTISTPPAPPTDQVVDQDSTPQPGKHSD